MNPVWLRTRTFLTLILLAGAASTAGAGVPVPIGGSPRPVPLDRVRVNNPAVLPLAGTWRFQLIHGEVTADGFRATGSGPASASGSQDGSSPDNVLPGHDGHWCAASGDFPQWWMVDLVKPEEVSGLTVDWEFKEGSYRFKTEGSLDGKTWNTLADCTTAPGGHDGPVAIQRGTLRFLRLTVVGAQRPGGTYAWACIKKVRLTVVENGKEVDWQPLVPPPDLAVRDAFARPGYSDANWSNIPVPANWEMEGFSKPTYDGPDDAVGLYRRVIDVPRSFTGQRVRWHFDGVTDGAEVFVNGQPVGYHEGGFTAFDMDVTKAIKPGQPNLLAVRVSKRTPSVSLDTGDYWCLGGIYRENYLVALPPTHVQDITVVTDLDARYVDANLNAVVQVAGAPGASVTLDAVLAQANGNVVPGVTLRGAARLGADGTATVQLQAPITAPRLWSAEKPNLYFLLLTLASDNQPVERVQERFGFRKVEIQKGVVLWNGQPIKCTGTCRHEEWAAYGHALGEAQWRKDIELMKGGNINAVRTSHYNHAERFLELCDEAGLYVLDEVPACWDDPKDLALLPAFVQHTRETLARDKDKACVLAWSLGNESGYGPDNQAMLDYAHANDPTRPAFISQCGPWNNPKIDFADYHYPDLASVKGIAKEKLRETTPAVFTEQPHIFYVKAGLDYDYGEKDLWGQVLANNWNIVWPTDGIVGSFVWEWQDQGIADKFPDKGGWVDPDGLRGNNGKGIVDGYRNPKPEYWNIKMVYSPVTTDAREVTPSDGKFTVPLQNRYAFTDLSELTCRWQALARDKVLAAGTAPVACAPRSTADGRFPVTPGADTLRIEFIHPDGRSLYAARLHVAGAPLPSPPAPLAAAGAVQLKDAPQELQIAAAGTVLTLDKTTGTIRSWKKGGEDIVTGGPTLNLGEARVDTGEHDSKNFIGSKEPPQLRNVTVTSALKGDTAHVEVAGDVYLVESPEPKGRLVYTLDVHPDAQADLGWKLAWQAPDAKAWELGMKLRLPKTLDRMTWSRQGLWTEYPPQHIGAADGTATSQDLTFRCTKRDARWMLMSGQGAGGLAVLKTDDPLHVRGRADADSTTAFLSSAVPPPYDFSTYLVPDLLVHLKTGQTVAGGFRLRVTN